jgi:hypothetical protein
MAVTIDGAGPIAGLTSIASPTTLNGLTIPTTGFGKILQIVRATDATNRSTTSTSFVDANISVTITPQKSTSAIIIIWNSFAGRNAGGEYLYMAISDASNALISGNGIGFGSSATSLYLACNIMGYDSPGVTTATTYKGRFRSALGNSVEISNAANIGQIYAIEVSA